MYNLAEDIYEDTDVAAQHPEILQQMVNIVLREHTDNDLFPATLPQL
ncbi:MULTISPECIES: hypothetical protein [Bacteroides]|uniref:Uncharacterized protein n=1 Tax=Bacteroides muris (ex Fokt et al. 2023) TaxID=2937417 RepID=A0A9X2P0Q5_9BACE|nr:hypothetical protein [Bacteroides muris (ex Fokt et al. 2023)]MCR6503700.1 hypothetical protein [Bacteroides muris (ex Fokt et al. 2023)]MCR6508857.1 hypothetical protein [Bacteroides muris (ex Fokt et al. 2023)]